MVVRSAPNLYLMRINRVSGRRLCMSRGYTFKNEVFKDRRGTYRLNPRRICENDWNVQEPD